MRLSDYTDYALRVLMYCAAHPQRRVTIAELAALHGLSKNHLMKVVNDLARQGYLETTRGRGGGLRMLKDPTGVRIGDIVRACESDFRMAECFDAAGNTCSMVPGCGLRDVLQGALGAYFSVLDGVTLAQIAPLPADAPRPLHWHATQHEGDRAVAAPRRPTATPRAPRRAPAAG